jgi:hypothetical protein
LTLARTPIHSDWPYAGTLSIFVSVAALCCKYEENGEGWGGAFSDTSPLQRLHRGLSIVRPNAGEGNAFGAVLENIARPKRWNKRLRRLFGKTESRS